MENAIRAHLRENGMFDNISLASLLESLYESDEGLALQVEEVMAEKGISSARRISSFLSQLEEDESEEQEEEADDEEDEEEE